jgi:hypothetical protein
MPESLRWLILKHRIDKAERLVYRISTFNRIPFPTDVWNVILAESEATASTQNFHFVHLFKTPKLRQRTFVLFYLW